MRLILKEWRQQKWFILFGILAAWLFPLREIIQEGLSTGHWAMRWDPSRLLFVLLFGPVFAIILSLATTAADVRSGVDIFWQSRPISITRLVLTKFLAGAFLLAIGFTVVVLPEILTGHRYGTENTAFLVMTYIRSLWLFALTMFLMILLRDATKAVMFAFWSGLLLYFLPWLTDTLRWFNMAETPSRGWSRPDIILYLMTITWIILAIFSLKRQWRWQPGQKTLAWVIGLSVAMGTWLIMTQVGQNLTLRPCPEDPFRTPPNYYDWATSNSIPRDMSNHLPWLNTKNTSNKISGNLLYTLSNKVAYTSEDARTKRQSLLLDIRRFTPQDNIGDNPRINLLSQTRFHLAEVPSCWQLATLCGHFLRDHDVFIAYQLERNEQGQNPLTLLRVDVSDPCNPRRLDESILLPKTEGIGAMVYENDHGYFADQKNLVVFRLNATGAIEKTSQIDVGRVNSYNYDVQVKIMDHQLLWHGAGAIRLYSLTDPAQPRFMCNIPISDLRFNYIRPDDIGDVYYRDHTLYVTSTSGIYIYQLTPQADGTLTSQLVGRRKATPLERLAGRRTPLGLYLVNNNLVDVSGFGVLVYDVSHPEHPRRIYHGQAIWPEDVFSWNGNLYIMGAFQLWGLTLPPSPGHQH